MVYLSTDSLTDKEVIFTINVDLWSHTDLIWHRSRIASIQAGLQQLVPHSAYALISTVEVQHYLVLRNLLKAHGAQQDVPLSWQHI